MVTRTYTITAGDFPQVAKGAVDMINFNPRLKCGVFFDIETTGFSASKNALYLIGCCRYDNGSWVLTQWMAEDESAQQQRLVLEHFLKELDSTPTLITYNGQTFDLPFIEKKCAALKIPVDFSRWEHWDLYKDVRSFGKLLGLDNLKLKTVERFLGIFREDTYSGGALIPIYKNYAKNHSQELEELLLLHNYEDIKDMLFILPILAYRQIADSSWIFSEAAVTPTDAGETTSSSYTFIAGTDQKVIGAVALTVSFAQPLPTAPKALTFELPLKPQKGGAVQKPQDGSPAIDGGIRVKLSFTTRTMTLLLPLAADELRYFYDNYKDYYYLPEEDCAVHKSVAAYVDKAYRKRATAQNCYTKKAGRFLPQPEQIFSPAFKYQYDHKLSWFEYTDTVFTNETVRKYIQCFLRFLNLGSF